MVAKFLPYLLLCGLVFSTDLNADDALYDEVIDSLQEWRQSFSTLRIVYEVRNIDQDYDGSFDLNAPPAADHVVWRYDFAWSEEGKIRARQERFMDRVRTRESIYGSDGTTNYEAHFNIEKDASPRLRELTLRRERMPSPGMKFGIHPLMGLWSNHSTQWLFEAFDQHGAEFLGFHEENRRFPAFLSRTTRYKFDREYSYLTRSRLPGPDSSNPDGLLFYVDEFRILEQGLPFPWSGRLLMGPEYKTRWQVFIAEPNVSLPKDFFAPPEPEKGTIVIDRIRGTQFVVGEEQPTTPAAIAAAARVEQHQEAGEPVVALVPASTLARWSLGLACVGTMLLIVTLWFRWRDHKSSPPSKPR